MQGWLDIFLGLKAWNVEAESERNIFLRVSVPNHDAS